MRRVRPVPETNRQSIPTERKYDERRADPEKFVFSHHSDPCSMVVFPCTLNPYRECFALGAGIVRRRISHVTSPTFALLTYSRHVGQ